jgi:hypothetical protein
MTPEEIQRNIEFIIASQARLTAAQETTTRSHERLFQQLAKTQRQMTELLVHQSERMDRFDRVHEKLSRDEHDSGPPPAPDSVSGSQPPRLASYGRQI